MKAGSTSCKRCDAVLDIIHQYGGEDGAHHKQWVLDQVLRAILGDKYEAWIHEFEFEPSDTEHDDERGEDGRLYEWDTGITP